MEGPTVEAPERDLSDELNRRQLADVAKKTLTEISGTLEDDATVLVASASPKQRATVVRLLPDTYRVTTVEAGNAALAAAKSIFPDLIIADSELPEVDGYGLCDAIRRHPGRLGRSRVILLGPEGEVGQKVEAFERGADDYLASPFHDQELLSRAKNLIRLKRHERHLFLVLRELTETQDQLVQSQRVAATASLAAGIAHHINNPLTSVLGYLQILGSRLRKSGDHPELLELLATAEEQSVRIKDIVSTLQALAEDQAAKTSDPVSVHETIEGALKVVEEENVRKGIEVVRDFESSLPGVMGSQNRLHLLLLYVFKNAREAMPEGGRLYVATAATEDKTVTITVGDDGEGIPSEHLSRVFDPFFTTKRDKRHKGLGLSIAHRIVQEHGGSIRATSTVGEGTTIKITLPAKRSWAHLV